MTKMLVWKPHAQEDRGLYSVMSRVKILKLPLSLMMTLMPPLSAFFSVPPCMPQGVLPARGNV